jgi:YD repeat-containing protein
MKANFVLIIFFLILFGCSKKQDTTSTTSQNPLLKTISEDTTLVGSFWYDSQGRITCSRTDDSPGIDSTVFSYSGNTLERKYFYNGILSEIEHGVLVNGNAVSIHGNNADSSSYWSTYYTYDQNGYLIREIHMDNDTVETWRAEYQILDGNIISMTRSNYLPVVFTYEYYPGTINSLKFNPFQDIITFLGKSSKNLEKKMIWSYSVGMTGEQDDTYEYYPNGWVKKMNCITSSETARWNFTYW